MGMPLFLDLAGGIGGDGGAAVMEAITTTGTDGMVTATTLIGATTPMEATDVDTDALAKDWSAAKRHWLSQKFYEARCFVTPLVETLIGNVKPFFHFRNEHKASTYLDYYCNR